MTKQMTEPLEPLKFRNNIRLQRLSVQTDDPEGRCAMRSLFWGASEECEIMGAPPGLISSECAGEELRTRLEERSDYFNRVLAAILGFSNTFGGRIFLGVKRGQVGGKRFFERVVLPVDDRRKRLNPKEADVQASEKLAALGEWIQPLNTRDLGSHGPFEKEPEPEQSAAAHGRVLSLYDCFDFENLVVYWYNTTYGRKYPMSIQGLLNNHWVTLNAIECPGGGEIPYLQIHPMPNGEVSHSLHEDGELVFRIGKRVEKRGNLVGINWSIFQSLRYYAQSKEHDDAGSSMDGPTWPRDRSDPEFVFEAFCYVGSGNERPSWYERLSHRAVLTEFYQTLSVGRRGELAQSLTETVWSHLGGPDGAVLYREALHRLELAEISSRHLNAEYQRDHVIHSCNVLFLGAYLWRSSRYIGSRLALVKDAHAVWAMAATSHDIGYPFELFLWALYEELRLFNVKAATLLGPIFGSSSKKKDLESLFDQAFWNRMEKALDFPSGSMKKVFDQKVKQVGIVNHGIVSAMLLEKLGQRLVSEGKWNSEHLKLVDNAAPAVAAHDSAVHIVKDGEIKILPFTLEKHSLAYLLILCDVLQEWDRSAVHRHVLIPSSVNIKTILNEDGNETILVNMTLDSKRTDDMNRELSTRICHRIAVGTKGKTRKKSLPGLKTEVQAYNSALGDHKRKIRNADASVSLLVKVSFVPMGVQLKPQDDTLALDVGGDLREGIIDHHQVGAPIGECASSLVYAHPEYVLNHLASSRMGKTTFIIHEKPDFDAICAFFLARRLILYGEIPNAWLELVQYAREVDTARLKLDPVRITRSPYAILSAISHLNKNYTKTLSRGLALMQHLANWLERGLSLTDQDLFTGRHPFEEEQAFIGRDYDNYLMDLSRTEQHRITLPRLYAMDKGDKTVDLAIISRPRSQMFKVWARMDLMSVKKGFTATAVHMRTSSKTNNRSIVSVDPSLPMDEIVSIAGLGEALTELEDRKRVECNIPPIPRTKPRKGYPNKDPWYDGRGSSFSFTIVDSPGDGSALTPEEINALVLNPEQWIQPDAEKYLANLQRKYGKADR